jgi:hypothetical protein
VEFDCRDARLSPPSDSVFRDFPVLAGSRSRGVTRVKGPALLGLADFQKAVRMDDR